MRIGVLVVLIIGVASSTAWSAIKTKSIKYKDYDAVLTGHLYWDDSAKEKRPGVLVVHEWWGLNDYAKKRARMLAELGYVAFAADMYGDQHVTSKPSQAQEWMQEITADVEGWRDRARLGLQQLVDSGLVENNKLAAIGYCFGGATVLQMSYDNAPVRGVVSFHGALPAAPDEVKGKITPQILVLHGQADSFVAPEVVQNFRNKLDDAGAKWEMNSYGGVHHGFTNPNAASFGIDNLKYDRVADQRSWQRMQAFFSEIFGAE